MWLEFFAHPDKPFMDKLVSQYVTDSLRLNGQLWTPGAQPSPEQLTECTAFFNQMLDGWNAMRNMLYAISDLTFSLSAGQYSYTIGPGGNLNGPRPQKIERANLIYQTAPTVERLPIEIIDVDQWASIRLPQLKSGIRLKLYYDNSYSQTTPTGQGVIYLWPAPQANYQLELFIWSTLPSTLLATSTLFAPPAYARALTYNLAVEIMPLYPKRMTQEREEQIMRVAMESRDAIASLNAPNPVSVVAPELIRERGFNWLTSVS